MSSRRSIGSERGLQLLSIGLANFHLRLGLLVLGLTLLPFLGQMEEAFEESRL